MLVRKRDSSPAGKESLYGFPNARGKQLSNSGLGIFASVKGRHNLQAESLALLNQSLKHLPHNQHHGDFTHLNHGDPRPLKTDNYQSRTYSQTTKNKNADIPVKLSNPHSFIPANRMYGRHSNNPASIEGIQRRIMLDPVNR